MQIVPWAFSFCLPWTPRPSPLPLFVTPQVSLSCPKFCLVYHKARSYRQFLLFWGEGTFKRAKELLLRKTSLLHRFSHFQFLKYQYRWEDQGSGQTLRRHLKIDFDQVSLSSHPLLSYMIDFPLSLKELLCKYSWKILRIVPFWLNKKIAAPLFYLLLILSWSPFWPLSVDFWTQGSSPQVCPSWPISCDPWSTLIYSSPASGLYSVTYSSNTSYYHNVSPSTH